MCNNTEIKEEHFNEWIILRTSFQEEKRQKNYVNVISIAEKIIQLDTIAKHIGIMVPIFYKEIGMAYYNLGNMKQSLLFYQQSIKGFENYRLTHKLNKPDDWLKEISIITKKIMLIQKKI